MNELVTLTRDCEAAVVPFGTKVVLAKGERAQITQSLGGSYTVVVNGNMFRIERPGRRRPRPAAHRYPGLGPAAGRARHPGRAGKAGLGANAQLLRPRNPGEYRGFGADL